MLNRDPWCMPLIELEAYREDLLCALDDYPEDSKEHNEIYDRYEEVLSIIEHIS